jgi:cell division protein FtsZ
VMQAAPAPVEGVQASAVQASVAETIAARTAAPIKPVISRTPADPFVAPPPAVPPSKSVVEAPASADPFNAAAMANAGGPTAKAQSLFQRVTGMGRKAREEAAPATDLLDGASPQMAQPAAPSQAAVAQPTPAEGHPKLGSLDRADRVTPSGADDDLLDIPAFLRRQAN